MSASAKVIELSDYQRTKPPFPQRPEHRAMALLVFRGGMPLTGRELLFCRRMYHLPISQLPAEQSMVRLRRLFVLHKYFEDDERKKKKPPPHGEARPPGQMTKKKMPDDEPPPAA